MCNTLSILKHYRNKYMNMTMRSRTTCTSMLLVCFWIFQQANVVVCECSKNMVIFNFGDSNSDTGGFPAAHGIRFGFPDGRTFFHQPSDRLCDGRLILDFLCKSFLPFCYFVMCYNFCEVVLFVTKTLKL